MGAYSSLDQLGLAPSVALAVVAHPDDESFGLGAVLAGLTDRGVQVRVLCFTHGEASTLGAAGPDLGRVRAREMELASAELSVETVRLMHLPDGHLAEVSPDLLSGEVRSYVDDADLLVLFEPGGVTGHPDHRAASSAAWVVACQLGIAVLEWGVPADVADALNAEYRTAFTAMSGIDVAVDRRAQRRAIRCHESQARDNPVLERRLELLGHRERVRLRVPPHDREGCNSTAGLSPLLP